MNSRHRESEISIREVLRWLWNRRFRVSAVIVVACIAVGAATFMMTKRYETSIVVEPVSGTPSVGSGAMGSLGSSLASLAGISMGSDPRKVESVAIVQSEFLTQRYIERNNLLPVLFARDWDSSRSTWKISDPKKMPTLWKASEYFKRSIRSVTTDGKTGLVTLKIIWSDPDLAAKWANGLIEMANEFERDSAIAESERNIAYLTSEAQKTDIVGVKQVIYSLLESEFNKAMLAKGNPQYAFKVIDPALVPEKPSFPNKIIWVLTAFFTTAFIALFWAFCAVAWNDDRS